MNKNSPKTNWKYQFDPEFMQQVGEKTYIMAESFKQTYCQVMSLNPTTGKKEVTEQPSCENCEFVAFPDDSEQCFNCYGINDESTVNNFKLSHATELLSPLTDYIEFVEEQIKKKK